MKPHRALNGTATLELLDQVFTKLATRDVERTELPLFIAIDIEAGDGKLHEIGFSTFDPCCLLLPLAHDLDSLNNCITTHYYARAGNKNRHHSKPYRLGTAQLLRHTIAHQASLFDIHIQSERRIILVGHHITIDLNFIKRHLNICLSQLPNLEAIVDTQQLSQLNFKYAPFPSLKRVLQDLGLDYIGLHNAGHDSRYTLRALLMLFIISKQSSKASQSVLDLIVQLEMIARSHKVNARRTWTPNTKVKQVRATALFDREDVEDEFGMLSLLA